MAAKRRLNCRSLLAIHVRELPMKTTVRGTADHLREAATICAVAVTLWAVMPRLMTFLFRTLYPLATFVFSPDSVAFHYLFHVLMFIGFMGFLMVVSAIYRRLICLLTGVRASPDNVDSA